MFRKLGQDILVSSWKITKSVKETLELQDGKRTLVSAINQGNHRCHSSNTLTSSWFSKYSPTLSHCCCWRAFFAVVSSPSGAQTGYNYVSNEAEHSMDSPNGGTDNQLNYYSLCCKWSAARYRPKACDLPRLSCWVTLGSDCECSPHSNIYSQKGQWYNAAHTLS